MSELQEEPASTFDITMRPIGSAQVQLRQIALGFNYPLVLIEFEATEDGGIKMSIDATGPTTKAEMLDCLGMVVEAVESMPDDPADEEAL
jgi:hypothetical protein